MSSTDKLEKVICKEPNNQGDGGTSVATNKHTVKLSSAESTVPTDPISDVSSSQQQSSAFEATTVVKETECKTSWWCWFWPIMLIPAVAVGYFLGKRSTTTDKDFALQGRTDNHDGDDPKGPKPDNHGGDDHGPGSDDNLNNHRPDGDQAVRNVPLDEHDAQLSPTSGASETPAAPTQPPATAHAIPAGAVFVMPDPNAPRGGYNTNNRNTQEQVHHYPPVAAHDPLATAGRGAGDRQARSDAERNKVKETDQKRIEENQSRFGEKNKEAEHKVPEHGGSSVQTETISSSAASDEQQAPSAFTLSNPHSISNHSLNPTTPQPTSMMTSLANLFARSPVAPSESPSSAEVTNNQPRNKKSEIKKQINDVLEKFLSDHQYDRNKLDSLNKQELGELASALLKLGINFHLVQDCLANRGLTNLAIALEKVKTPGTSDKACDSSQDSKGHDHHNDDDHNPDAGAPNVVNPDGATGVSITPPSTSSGSQGSDTNHSSDTHGKTTQSSLNKEEVGHKQADLTHDAYIAKTINDYMHTAIEYGTSAYDTLSPYAPYVVVGVGLVALGAYLLPASSAGVITEAVAEKAVDCFAGKALEMVAHEGYTLVAKGFEVAGEGWGLVAAAAA